MIVSNQKEEVVSSIIIMLNMNGDRNKNLSLREHLNKIEPYLRHIIIDLQKSDTWRIQLTITINLISSKDAEKKVMHSSSNNIKFTSYNDANEAVDELFDSLRSRYQGNFEVSMKRSDLFWLSSTDALQKL